MKPAEPASAISLGGAPQSRSDSSGLTPEKAAIHVAQLLLDLAREIRRPRAYIGYTVHTINELIRGGIVLWAQVSAICKHLRN